MKLMSLPSDPTPQLTSPTLRWTLFIIGCIAVGLGVIGIFLPLLPTVPFLLLALACFARSSARFYSWLHDHTHLGPLVRPYLQGRGLNRATKIKAIGLVWISIGLSMLFFVEIFWIRGVLLIIALGVSLYLFRLPTSGDENQEEGS
jgi:uncharacterized membrane protein YbaN (DUF454 family)